MILYRRANLGECEEIKCEQFLASEKKVVFLLFLLLVGWLQVQNVAWQFNWHWAREGGITIHQFDQSK